MESSQESLFQQAMNRYQQGAPAQELLADFETITAAAPRQSAGWTCLAWLQLLNDQSEEAPVSYTHLTLPTKQMV